jgi:hypothetical protein
MRYLMLVSVLLLGVSWAAAQDQSTAGQTSQDQSAATQTTSGNGGTMTVTGCLSGSDGNYTLTDKNGTAYQLTGDTAKLSEHVGHEIKVTGSANSAAASTGGTDNQAGAGSQQTLSVNTFKHISKTCQNSGAMSK